MDSVLGRGVWAVRPKLLSFNFFSLAFLLVHGKPFAQVAAAALPVDDLLLAAAFP